jgi:hypothetical protein
MEQSASRGGTSPVRQSKQFLFCMVPEGSLPFSKYPATELYLATDDSDPHPSIPVFSELNLIVPSHLVFCPFKLYN